jgi:hypothetical protein
MAEAFLHISIIVKIGGGLKTASELEEERKSLLHLQPSSS